MDYPIGKKERDLVDWISNALERKELFLDKIMNENRIICHYEAQLSDAQKRPMSQRLLDTE